MPTIRNTTSNQAETAFHGVSQGDSSIALFGQGKAVGVRGDGETWHGVAGISRSTVGGSGVKGEHLSQGPGVHGSSVSGVGVYGTSKTRPAVQGVSESHEGVHAESTSPTTAAIAAYQNNAGSTGAALYARHAGNRTAGLFQGNVVVTGNLDVSVDVRLTGGDLAEQFEVVGGIPAVPGSVMVLAGPNQVRVSDKSYDRRVAGVISGAGDYRPGVVLDSRQTSADARPLALTGKVWVLADADQGPIEVGDLLTTSETPGHAMKVSDPLMAFGAVIGKALGSRDRGTGLIPILVALQ